MNISKQDGIQTELAISRIGIASNAAYFYGALLAIAGALGYILDNISGPFSQYINSAAMVDAVILIALATYIRQRSTVASLLLMAYFLIAQVTGAYVQGKVGGALFALLFLYWFWNGIVSTRILKKQGYLHSRSKLANIVYWVFGAIGGTSLVILLAASILQALGLF
jgi:hypothetical protein